MSQVAGEIVVGEAVVLDLRPARVPSRALAFAIDATIMLVLLTAVLVVMALAGDEFDPALRAAVLIVVAVGTFVGYPLAWETLTRGRSPGKLALGLRVVRDDGGPVLFRQALARSLAGFFVDFGVLSSFSGVIGLVSSLVSRRGKRVGDLLAGTIVLRERVPRLRGRGPSPQVPPVLGAWASAAEMSAVGDDLALSARQFLARAPRMDPARRAALAQNLAGEVAARVAPPPPPGVPAETYLDVVLAERRRREIARLTAVRDRARSATSVAPCGTPDQTVPTPTSEGPR